MDDETAAPAEPQPVPADAGQRFLDFVRLIARLRAPGGCPWDAEQTHESVKPMTIEEAYEVAHAIDDGDDGELAGELGDLLLQVVFHSDIAARRGAFDVTGVIARVADKMIERHPHVFGDVEAETSGAVLRNWEAQKQAERAAKGKAGPASSMLESVSRSLPAVMESYQMSVKAARVGFDWPDARACLAKVEEELVELRQAIEEGGPTQTPARRAVYEEVGDLLFATVNVARLLDVDPESALKAANRKFRSRFAHVEARLLERGRTPAQSTLDEMEGLWEEAKDAERGEPTE